MSLYKYEIGAEIYANVSFALKIRNQLNEWSENFAIMSCLFLQKGPMIMAEDAKVVRCLNESLV